MKDTPFFVFREFVRLVSLFFIMAEFSITNAY